MLKTEEALTRLAQWLSQTGRKFTGQRKLITEVFFDPRHRRGHPSVDELHQAVRARDPSVGYATVYRTLKLLVECGLAMPRQLGDNQTRYEPEAPGEHHDHLVCLDCGAIVEFENPQIEKLQEEVAAEFGFEIESHRMVLYGRCGGECATPSNDEDDAPAAPA